MRLWSALLFLGFTPLFAQTNQLAGIQQDLAELRTEVEKLKLENADLREALARQKAGQAPAASSAETSAKLRTEVFTEVDRRLKQQTAEVNAALAELTRQVNTALGKPASAGTVKSTAPANNPPATTPPANSAVAPHEDGFPADMPRTGVKYRVKSGDTVTKIARTLGSKNEWILIANKLASPAALRADVEIFVPQPETPAR